MSKADKLVQAGQASIELFMEDKLANVQHVSDNLPAIPERSRDFIGNLLNGLDMYDSLTMKQWSWLVGAWLWLNENEGTDVEEATIQQHRGRTVEIVLTSPIITAFQNKLAAINARYHTLIKVSTTSFTQELDFIQCSPYVELYVVYNVGTGIAFIARDIDNAWRAMASISRIGEFNGSKLLSLNKKLEEFIKNLCANPQTI